MSTPKLTKQDKKFLDTYAETGNGTQAAKVAFGIKDPNYAGVKAHRLIRKDKVLTALEEALPNETLFEIHREGLFASKPIFNDEGEKVSEEADYNARHKYLDTAYKLKGSYAPDRSVNINIEVEANPIIKELTQELNEIYRGTSESGDGGTTSPLGTEASH